MYIIGACLWSENGWEEVRLNAAKENIGIGDREGPTLAVADRAGMGSGTYIPYIHTYIHHN